jgi:riboflavin synthase
VGRAIHLERALRLSDRLGGHLVSGHVDGLGRIAQREEVGDTLKLRIEADPTILSLCIHKGSIAINGVSLTINVLDATGFEVWLIPHTLEKTRLGKLQIGDAVNLENDLVGKYVQRLLTAGPGVGATAPTLTWEKLREHGFVAGDDKAQGGQP